MYIKDRIVGMVSCFNKLREDFALDCLSIRVRDSKTYEIQTDLDTWLKIKKMIGDDPSVKYLNEQPGHWSEEYLETGCVTLYINNVHLIALYHEERAHELL